MTIVMFFLLYIVIMKLLEMLVSKRTQYIVGALINLCHFFIATEAVSILLIGYFVYITAEGILKRNEKKLNLLYWPLLLIESGLIIQLYPLVVFLLVGFIASKSKNHHYPNLRGLVLLLIVFLVTSLDIDFFYKFIFILGYNFYIGMIRGRALITNNNNVFLNLFVFPMFFLKLLSENNFDISISVTALLVILAVGGMIITYELFLDKLNLRNKHFLMFSSVYSLCFCILLDMENSTKAIEVMLLLLMGMTLLYEYFKKEKIKSLCWAFILGFPLTPLFFYKINLIHKNINIYNFQTIIFLSVVLLIPIVGLIPIKENINE